MTFSSGGSWPGFGEVSVEDLTRQVEKLRRDYPEPPVRILAAPGLCDLLRDTLVQVHGPVWGGIGVYASDDFLPGEWAPVFRVESR